MVDSLPRLGVGTSNLGIRFGDAEDDPQECVDAIEAALEVGYRHVDTAQMYGNEHLVGEGIARSSVPREDVFLATKVDPGNLAYDDVIESTEASLEALGTDYVDLLYVHWPIDAYDPEDTLPAFDRLHDEGKARHVGVSNFTVDLLEEARDVLDAPVVANQMQMHPKLPPTEEERAELLPYAREHDVDLVAWSPLLRGDALSLPEVEAVAEKHGRSPAQVVLAWLFGYGVKAVARSTSPAHLRDNLGALTLELDEADVERIESVEERERIYDREAAPWNR